MTQDFLQRPNSGTRGSTLLTGVPFVKIAVCFLFLAGSLGCTTSPTEEQAAEEKSEVPMTKPEEPAAAQELAQEQSAAPEAMTAPEPQVQSITRTMNDPEPNETAGSGQTVWATGKEGVLVRGLDGGLYEAYLPSVVEEVQRVLRDQGLYSGEITGILDEATMKALGEFQEQENLQVSGVPSPETREELGVSGGDEEANSMAQAEVPEKQDMGTPTRVAAR